MATPAREIPSLGHVEAPLSFIIPSGEKPRVYIDPPGSGIPRRQGRFEWRTVPIHDARPIAGELSLEREGFELRRVPTAVEDFYSEEEVRSVYYPEMEALVKEATGARRVLVFDHTLRAGTGEEADRRGLRHPVRVAHNDYTDRSGPQRVRDLLPGEAEALLRRRHAVVNVWRPIRGPVLSHPLALGDARSFGPGELVETDLVYRDRVGEIQHVAWGEGQRWYYFPRMERDEVVLIKCYDSERDGRARFSAHSAFEDPTTPPDAPPRESIEIRTWAFF